VVSTGEVLDAVGAVPAIVEALAGLARLPLVA
jgi:hypothetical protein